MVLRWLDEALDDLRAIKAYIAEENPDAARRVIASIRSETGILPNQPIEFEPLPAIAGHL